MQTETAASVAKYKMRMVEEIDYPIRKERVTQESIAYSLIAITEVLERMYKWGRA